MRIEPVLDVAAARAVQLESGRFRGRQRARVQHDPQAVVAQQGVEAVVRGGAITLDGKVEIDGARRPEQLQGLVDQMGAEVVPEPGARTGAVAPAIRDLRPEAVETGFEMPGL